MTRELTEAFTALSLILDEENERLADASFAPLPEALVAAKLRHVGLIEAIGVRLAQEPPAAFASDAVLELGELITTTVAKSQVNAALLKRRIALCDELMGAIATEARRLSGGSSTTYGARGAVSRSDRATPISINSRL